MRTTADSIEIVWSDLTAEAQAELLALVNIDDPEEENWDLDREPVAHLPKPSIRLSWD
jgi:hypothetical protein